jgi:hypothetical protein
VRDVVAERLSELHPAEGVGHVSAKIPVVQIG